MSDLPSVYMDGDLMVVRASASGECVRALAAYGRYDEVVPIQRRELLDRTATEGNLHEPTVVEYLIGQGYDISQAQQTVTLPIMRGRVEVRGHVDGLIPGEAVVEIKSMSKSRFDDWQRKGLHAFPKYQWQLSCYMYAVSDQWGTEPNAVYAVKRRDDGLVDVKEIPWPPPIPFQTIRKKLITVYQYRKKKALPECDVPKSEQWWCPFPFLHEGEDVEGLPIPEEREEQILELLTDYDNLRAIAKEGEAADQKRKEVGREILALMEDRDKITIGEWVVTRIKQMQTRVDLSLLRAELDPADLARYEKPLPIEYPKVTKSKKKVK